MSRLSIASEATCHAAGRNHVLQKPEIKSPLEFSSIVSAIIDSFNVRRSECQMPFITHQQRQRILQYIVQTTDLSGIQSLSNVQSEKEAFYRNLCEQCRIRDELILLHAPICTRIKLQHRQTTHSVCSEDNRKGNAITPASPSVTDTVSDMSLYLLSGYVRKIGHRAPMDIIAEMNRFWKAEQIQFAWNSTCEHVQSCDALHFLFVVDSCLAKINGRRRKKQLPVANSKIVLRYLQLIDMDGKRFLTMRKPQFARKLADDYVLQRGISTPLYEAIKRFDFKSKNDLEICTIPIGDKGQYCLLYRAFCKFNPLFQH